MNAAAAERTGARGFRGFNVLTGIVLGVAGFYFGWWLGHQIQRRASSTSPTRARTTSP